MTCKQTGGYILSTRLWRMFHEQITKSPFETKLFRPTCVMISYKGFEKKVSRCFSKIKHTHFLGTLKLVHILRGCENTETCEERVNIDRNQKLGSPVNCIIIHQTLTLLLWFICTNAKSTNHVKDKPSIRVYTNTNQ